MFLTFRNHRPRRDANLSWLQQVATDDGAGGRRRRQIWIGRAVAVVLTSAVAVVWSSTVGSDTAPSSSGLLPTDTETALISHDSFVGEHVWDSYSGLQAAGDDPVRLKRVEVLGVPAGMEILGVWVVNNREIGSAGLVMRGDRDALLDEYPDARLYPVDTAVISADEPYKWSVLVEVVATAPGRHRTDGLRVHWDGGSLVVKHSTGMDVDR